MREVRPNGTCGTATTSCTAAAARRVGAHKNDNASATVVLGFPNAARYAALSGAQQLNRA